MAQRFLIRYANLDDMKNIFELSNDDEVRKNSFSTEKIKWDEHVKWYNNRLQKRICPFYIIEDIDGRFIGQVRIDIGDETIISISITKDFRGKKLASQIIRQCSQKSGFKEIYAYFKKKETKRITL